MWSVKQQSTLVSDTMNLASMQGIVWLWLQMASVFLQQLGIFTSAHFLDHYKYINVCEMSRKLHL